MPMITPPDTPRFDLLDDTREQLYVLLSFIHEAKVPPCELRGLLVNRLIHHHHLATNTEMSELFTDIRLFEELRRWNKFKMQHDKPNTELTIPELSKKIKDTIKAYISLLTKQIEG